MQPVYNVILLQDGNIRFVLYLHPSLRDSLADRDPIVDHPQYMSKQLYVTATGRQVGNLESWISMNFNTFISAGTSRYL